MPLSWNEAKQIIDVVRADPCCQAVINDPLAWGEGLWLAGSIRNIALILGGMYEADRESFDRVSCVGISKNTAEAVNFASARGTKLLPTVRNSSICHRVLHKVHHNGTWIVMTDRTEYVFDWHATLNIRNPVISTRKDWTKGQGAIDFFHFPTSGLR